MNALLLAHIAVIGYWLGSELVINSTFRYASWAASMPIREREQLLEHVLDIDQHVRYALILQAGLGTALAALLGYLPGGRTLAGLAAVATVGWLVLVEFTHRLRKERAGKRLASVDHVLRYIAVLALLALGVSAWAGYIHLVGWLALKLGLFAGVIACGLGIRFEIIRYFRVWQEIASDGSNDARESGLRRRYISATAVLGTLWLFIAGIIALSFLKP